MSSQQSPGLLAQFFESFFGISWRSEEEGRAEAAQAPLCKACHNPVKRNKAGLWGCPHHPNAPLIERAQRDDLGQNEPEGA